MTQEEELQKLREAVDYINAAPTTQERQLRKLRMYTTLYGTPLKLEK